MPLINIELGGTKKKALCSMALKERRSEVS